MKTLKLNLHSDPGHGWLAVPIKKYIDSGILTSNCSYVNDAKTTVYLEEDLDAGLFIESMRNKGIEIQMNVKYLKNSSRIRNMNRLNDNDEMSLSKNEK